MTTPLLGHLFIDVMLSVIGPIAGGWIVQTKLGWRFNFWLMMMVSGFALTIGFLATPETVGFFCSMYDSFV